MQFLTKRQQQILRRMFFGSARWQIDEHNNHWQVNGWVLPFAGYGSDDDDLLYTTTTAFRGLVELGYVGEAMTNPKAGRDAGNSDFCFALTHRGTLVAAALLGKEDLFTYSEGDR